MQTSFSYSNRTYREYIDIKIGLFIDYMDHIELVYI